MTEREFLATILLATLLAVTGQLMPLVVLFVLLCLVFFISLPS